MKKIVLILSFILLICGLTYAGSSQRVGNTTFHTFDDGTTATSQNVGGTTFHNFNNGSSGTSQNVGGTTFNNWND